MVTILEAAAVVCGGPVGPKLEDAKRLRRCLSAPILYYVYMYMCNIYIYIYIYI
jgi:hypothetical protein